MSITRPGNNAPAALFTGPPDATLSEARHRPYRSHKIPACERCRKRKLRCDVDRPGQPCRLCRHCHADCVRDERSPLSKRGSPVVCHGQAANESSRRRIVHTSPGAGTSPEQMFTPSHQDAPAVYQKSSAGAHSYVHSPRGSASKASMIVGPVIAGDVQLVERYMSSQSRNGISPREGLYSTLSDNPKDPVLYLSVPRRREGLSSTDRPGEKQKEIFEQILGPHIEEVINLYFAFVHPSFPIIDERNFLRFYKSGEKNLSPALICEMLASSLIYWNKSSILQRYPQPNIRYCWNLAVVALQEEFLAPGMSTVHAALLDLTGRPVASITGNTINSGRTVALAHSIGLNRDPSNWRIPGGEKRLRVRLWWAVVIHDRWSSFAHGVPSHIRKYDYDVPVPTLEDIVTVGNETSSRISSAECFIALCTLTEILGDILRLVYHRRPKPEVEIRKSIRRLETELDQWEESLPIWSASQNEQVQVSGYSSLRLGFLSAKMLLCRVSFLSANQATSSCVSELRSYSLAMLRESSRAIITFLCSLNSPHLQEFWMPYSAYHLASATITLIRCTIETTDVATAEYCRSNLNAFKEWLVRAKEIDNWDLADICLTQCGAPIANLNEDCRPVVHGAANPNLTQLSQDGNFMLQSVIDPQGLVDEFEYPFTDLWDMLEHESQTYV